MTSIISAVHAEFSPMASDHLLASVFRIWGETVSMQPARWHNGFTLKLQNDGFWHPLLVAEADRCRVHLHHGERYSRLEVAYPTAKAPEEALRSALFVSYTLSSLLEA